MPNCDRTKPPPPPRGMPQAMKQLRSAQKAEGCERLHAALVLRASVCAGVGVRGRVRQRDGWVVDVVFFFWNDRPHPESPAPRGPVD